MPNETRLKRLQYRSSHRGNKEMDIVFSRFSEAWLAQLDQPILDLYEELLEENDVDIWDWLLGKNPPEKYAPILALLTESD